MQRLRRACGVLKLRVCTSICKCARRPQELELLACGGRQLDMEALESATVHDDGYTSDSQASLQLCSRVSRLLRTAMAAAVAQKCSVACLVYAARTLFGVARLTCLCA